MYITQSLKRAVQINANGIATIDGDRQRTWRTFANRVARLAAVLRNLKLSQGGRVAILALNSDRYLESYFAVPWADGIFVPLNIRLAPPELIFMLNDCEAEILIVDETFKALLPAFAGQVPALKQIIYADSQTPPPDAVDYESAIATAQPIPDAERGGDAVAGIFYTGGTTGLPKGVMLTHDNLMHTSLGALAINCVGTSLVWPHTAPMFHLADCSVILTVTLFGGVHAFIPKFDPLEAIKVIERCHATHCLMLPVMLNTLVNMPELQAYDLSSLQTVFYAGGVTAPSLLAKAMTMFPHTQFAQAYAMTETSATLTTLESHHHSFEGPLAHRIKSCGRADYAVEVKIVDLEDNEVSRGVVGEIITRGPHVMKGYWNRPEETAHALRNGWMHTGDAGYMDEDGFVYIVDRYKDMIKSGGENVFSAEVENAIYQHPAVAMCAVIAIPDERWGEAVHAIVQPKAGQSLSPEAVIQHCRGLIAGYKCPRSVEITQSPLPLSGAGKIMKGKLREPYWQGRERQVA